MKVGVSLSSYKGEMQKEDFEAIKNAGFDYAEITVPFLQPFEVLQDVLEYEAKWAMKVGLEPQTLHLPFGERYDITAPVCEGFDELKILIQKSAGYGIKIAVLHGSFEPIKESERENRILEGNSRIKELSDFCDSLGMKLAVECLPRTCIGNCADECLALIENTSAGICLDVNHLLIDTHEEFIDKLWDKIITTHISDYDRVDERHWLPGKGIINLRKVLGRLKEGVLYTLEVRNKDGDITPGMIMDAFKEQTKEYIALCEQRENQLLVYDADNPEKPCWTWKSDNENNINVSDVKMRHHKKHGDVLLTVASGGYAAMISFPEGKVLWEKFVGGNLHAIELLPNGKILTAASDGNTVSVFDEDDNCTEIYSEFSHGVLYDEGRNTFWILGSNFLKEYDVDTLEQKGNEFIFPENLTHGHDLAPYYGDSNLLWFTVNEGVYLYNKELNSIKKYEPMGENSVKGVGNLPVSKRVIALYPNGTYLPWCTDEYIVIEGENKKIFRNKEHAYYKIRVLSREYR